ncbi:hypothetical protein SCP_0704400 [Sparassis crispa]|uniref:DUF6589 domain-containing protein n=1 Tax=Sparassis crispa TaxID=139825 RepID=A0A401GSU1_9APHY|nr:hypothetical protein SCP_0704400 [Sparassis crispa]GBE85253.1 hypothetical protein SCP_0704400 [Sparassis crispa]
MFTSRHSALTPVRNNVRRESANGSPAEESTTGSQLTSQVVRGEGKAMARKRLQEWAIGKVEEILDCEAAEVSAKGGGFHLKDKDATWEFVLNFSMQKMMSLYESKAPTIVRLLIACAIPSEARPVISPERVTSSIPHEQNQSSAVNLPVSYADYLMRNAPSGRGKNRKDPLVTVLTACLLLMSARNLHSTAFRKVVGVWLFAHTAHHGLYSILSRLGFSVSYTSVLKLLRRLAVSAKEVIQRKSTSRAFLLIYDNINRMKRAWDPDLGQKDAIHNGTAATYVELEDCDVEKAFDVKALRESQQQERRKQLDLGVLYKRINWMKLNATMATHILAILIEAIPALSVHLPLLRIRFETTLMIHRMRKGRKTGLYPMATSDYNEGNTAENAKVLEDLLVEQLGMPKEEIEKMLVIIGGDQSTVEKLQTLKRYVTTCPHGYSRHGWVLPLIQLWHMGWADLERVLNTHWGVSTADDLSSFRSANVLLGRKVKDQRRPDYYPTQRLIFDTLRAEVLDCWRIELDVADLHEHFHPQASSFEDLLKHANNIFDRYLTVDGYTHALDPMEDPQGVFATGDPWAAHAEGDTETGNSGPSFRGDQVLANTILRMRDSMLHYEFQCAIAEGDIGRAMNVMSVWTFTFAGSGKSKYTNELLELTCNFEFEYSDELKKAILNNWLCNLSGIEGCWFPMDLMQEKNIKQLKKMSQRADVTFGGPFFRDVIALNIRAFLESMASMKAGVRLLDHGGSHRRDQKEAAMKELARHIAEQGLHRFRVGRTSTHAAQDDFEVGYQRLVDGKRIKDFVARTLRDAGAIHGDEDLDTNAVASNPDITSGREDSDIPSLPSVLVNGQLIHGAAELEQDHEEYLLWDSDDSTTESESGDESS